MKVAVLSESVADEAAIRILLQPLLGGEMQPVDPPPLRARGYDAVRQALGPSILHCHYQTDADGLIVVVDSNGTPLHDAEHEQPGGVEPRCRLCRFRDAVNEVRGQMRAVAGRSELRVAIGVATPAIEAWYCCGSARHMTEATWRRDLAAGAHAPTEIRRLKQEAYGTDRPSLHDETRCAVEQARRLAADIAMLEKAFPNGFGALAREVRGW